MTGNIPAVGKHSAGYYDIKKYNKGKHDHSGDDKFLKTIYAHVGVVITRSKIYIEDSYVK